MPSQLHEAILLLFRNRPTLAPELMREPLHCKLPMFTEARIDSADLTEVKPAADPELAVLSAMAHGRDRDVNKAVRIALAAELGTQGLDEQRWGMYLDLVFDSLSEAARKELRAMNPARYQYRSDFAKHYIGLGEAQGRAALLQRQLTRRFGPLPAEAVERLSAATIDELDAIGERLLVAQSLDEALGPPPRRP